MTSGRESAHRTGVILGVVAVLSVAVFWSGLPVILGIAAIAIGVSYRGGENSGAATAAMVLGALALVGDVVVYILDLS